MLAGCSLPSGAGSASRRMGARRQSYRKMTPFIGIELKIAAILETVPYLIIKHGQRALNIEHNYWINFEADDEGVRIAKNWAGVGERLGLNLKRATPSGEPDHVAHSMSPGLTLIPCKPQLPLAESAYSDPAHSECEPGFRREEVEKVVHTSEATAIPLADQAPERFSKA
jgi:hypothetical protein